ncbi:hypothetical protein ABID37_003487 [Aquamicrobium terrae]|uniref:Uncharacterized protein n=1 Tax=Aquamicrobium terrae TaxID=1324945 RepID=A0ABV2N2H7_9HYPH
MIVMGEQEHDVVRIEGRQYKGAGAEEKRPPDIPHFVKRSLIDLKPLTDMDSAADAIPVEWRLGV